MSGVIPWEEPIENKYNKGLDYYTDDNVEMVRNTFDIDEMLIQLKRFGLISEITGDYSQDITDMCNNCVVMLANHLSTFALPSEIKVCEGVFAMKGNHTWIVIEGIIFDATLAQFVPDAPRLAILKENNHYQVVREYSLTEWIANI